MTLVCVRLEKSFNAPRITALADTRATIRRPDGSLKAISDTTEKLFVAPVRCYTGDSLTRVVGAWADPYYETTIGLAFSGSCFEALTVIAHVSRSLSGLVAPDGDEPRPTGAGLVNLIAKLCESYFCSHSGDGDPILLLLVFGYDGDKPWIGKITYHKSKGVQQTFTWATEDTLETVGDSALFQQYADDLRKRIEKHRQSVSKKPVQTPDASFERDLEVENHGLAERKSTEEAMLRQIESDFANSIGGVLQRLELAVECGRVVAGFTQDDRKYILDGASYSVAPGALLGPIPIVEKMGRQARNPETNLESMTSVNGEPDGLGSAS